MCGAASRHCLICHQEFYVSWNHSQKRLCDLCFGQELEARSKGNDALDHWVVVAGEYFCDACPPHDRHTVGKDWPCPNPACPNAFPATDPQRYQRLKVLNISWPEQIRLWDAFWERKKSESTGSR